MVTNKGGMNMDLNCLKVNNPWISILKRRWKLQEFNISFSTSFLNKVKSEIETDGVIWSLDDSGIFNAGSLRSKIDNVYLLSHDDSTSWNRYVPRKVDIMYWRLGRDRLPSKVKLNDKGIDLDSMLCSACHEAPESATHLFFECDFAKKLWDEMLPWFCISPREIRNPLDLSLVLDIGPRNLSFKLCLNVVFHTTCWWVWRARNAINFSRSR
ncbi:RNA-directed DNA polymerase, eukaryota [Tanacetum coccineum]